MECCLLLCGRCFIAASAGPHETSGRDDDSHHQCASNVGAKTVLKMSSIDALYIFDEHKYVAISQN